MPKKTSKVPRVTAALFVAVAILGIAAIFLVNQEVQESQIGTDAISDGVAEVEQPIPVKDEAPAPTSEAGTVDDAEAVEGHAVQELASPREESEEQAAEPESVASAELPVEPDGAEPVGEIADAASDVKPAAVGEEADAAPAVAEAGMPVDDGAAEVAAPVSGEPALEPEAGVAGEEEPGVVVEVVDPGPAAADAETPVSEEAAEVAATVSDEPSDELESIAVAEVPVEPGDAAPVGEIADAAADEKPAAVGEEEDAAPAAADADMPVDDGAAEVAAPVSGEPAPVGVAGEEEPGAVVEVVDPGSAAADVETPVSEEVAEVAATVSDEPSDELESIAVAEAPVEPGDAAPVGEIADAAADEKPAAVGEEEDAVPAAADAGMPVDDGAVEIAAPVSGEPAPVGVVGEEEPGAVVEVVDPGPAVAASETPMSEAAAEAAATVADEPSDEPESIAVAEMPVEPGETAPVGEIADAAADEKPAAVGEEEDAAPAAADADMLADDGAAEVAAPVGEVGVAGEAVPGAVVEELDPGSAAAVAETPASEAAAEVAATVADEPSDEPKSIAVAEMPVEPDEAAPVGGIADAVVDEKPAAVGHEEDAVLAAADADMLADDGAAEVSAPVGEVGVAEEEVPGAVVEEVDPGSAAGVAETPASEAAAEVAATVADEPSDEPASIAIAEMPVDPDEATPVGGIADAVVDEKPAAVGHEEDAVLAAADADMLADDAAADEKPAGVGEEADAAPAAADADMPVDVGAAEVAAPVSGEPALESEAVASAVGMPAEAVEAGVAEEEVPGAVVEELDPGSAAAVAETPVSEEAAKVAATVADEPSDKSESIAVAEMPVEPDGAAPVGEIADAAADEKPAAVGDEEDAALLAADADMPVDDSAAEAAAPVSGEPALEPEAVASAVRMKTEAGEIEEVPGAVVEEVDPGPAVAASETPVPEEATEIAVPVSGIPSVESGFVVSAEMPVEPDEAAPVGEIAAAAEEEPVAVGEEDDAALAASDADMMPVDDGAVEFAAPVSGEPALEPEYVETPAEVSEAGVAEEEVPGAILEEVDPVPAAAVAETPVSEEAAEVAATVADEPTDKSESIASAEMPVEPGGAAPVGEIAAAAEEEPVAVGEEDDAALAASDADMPADDGAVEFAAPVSGEPALEPEYVETPAEVSEAGVAEEEVPGAILEEVDPVPAAAVAETPVSEEAAEVAATVADEPTDKSESIASAEMPVEPGGAAPDGEIAAAAAAAEEEPVAVGEEDDAALAASDADMPADDGAAEVAAPVSGEPALQLEAAGMQAEAVEAEFAEEELPGAVVEEVDPGPAVAASETPVPEEAAEIAAPVSGIPSVEPEFVASAEIPVEPDGAAPVGEIAEAAADEKAAAVGDEEDAALAASDADMPADDGAVQVAAPVSGEPALEPESVETPAEVVDAGVAEEELPGAILEEVDPVPAAAVAETPVSEEAAEVAATVADEPTDKSESIAAAEMPVEPGGAAPDGEIAAAVEEEPVAVGDEDDAALAASDADMPADDGAAEVAAPVSGGLALEPEAVASVVEAPFEVDESAPAGEEISDAVVGEVDPAPAVADAETPVVAEAVEVAARDTKIPESIQPSEQAEPASGLAAKTDEVAESAFNSTVESGAAAIEEVIGGLVQDPARIEAADDGRKSAEREGGDLAEPETFVADGASKIKDSKEAESELEFILASELEVESLLNELAFLDTALLEPELPFGRLGEAESAAIEPPTFDIVRVDQHGTVVVAGRAAPGSRVEVVVDGVSAISAIADRLGEFAVTFDVEVAIGTKVISLAMRNPGVPALESLENVVVVVPQASLPVPDVDQAPAPVIDTISSPAVLLATADSIDLLQPGFEPAATSDASENVTIDVIYYDEQGEVVLSGRGKPGKSVIVYVDGKPEVNEPVGLGGAWKLPLSGIEAGRYTLRIDEVDEEGVVYSRVETPFQKELPELVLQKLEPDTHAAEPGELPRVTDDVAIRSITVQPGYTLWGISRSRYGLGRYYVRIYAANKDQIRDPNLIYPGQVFIIPD